MSSSVFLFSIAILLFFLANHLFRAARLSRRVFRVGSLVVYRAEKASTRIEAEAYDVHPSAKGELYYYSVSDYLRIVERLTDGRIIGIGRDNVRHHLRPDDIHLRRATWTERLLQRPRFPRA